EDAAAALARALRLDGAAVQLDEVPHDREPEAEPAVRARGGGVGLPEALEEPWQRRGADAGAVVADGEPDVAPGVRERDRDPAAARRELHRVRDEVPDHLLEALGVARDA